MRYSLTCGVFDCLHEGHINLFKEMKKASDKIVVILHDDKSTFENKSRFPVQEFRLRWHNLSLCGYIDRIIPVEAPDPCSALSFAISFYRPAVYMRGDDWPDFPGRLTVECADVPIKLVGYTKGVSTTAIRLKKEMG